MVKDFNIYVFFFNFLKTPLYNLTLHSIVYENIAPMVLNNET